MEAISSLLFANILKPYAAISPRKYFIILVPKLSTMQAALTCKLSGRFRIAVFILKSM